MINGRENDSLESLLIRRGRPMDSKLVGHLCRTLSLVIEQWLSDEIASGIWPSQEYPHTGPRTCYFMAVAALTVLESIYDAETDLVAEGWLDANAAILPE